jgi:hypothetical protein
MRTQVIEHLPQLATEVATLEVPAVQVQRVPVYEDQHDVISLAVIHFGVQHDTIRSDHVGAVGAQREELRYVCVRLARNSLRYDPALEFDAQRNPASREGRDTGD